jgi:hypothetical protein
MIGNSLIQILFFWEKEKQSNIFFGSSDNLLNLHPLTLPLINTFLNGQSKSNESDNSSENLHPHRRKPNRYKVKLPLDYINKTALQTAKRWNLNEDQTR